MAALTLTVFISSPGDVGQERLLATHVLEQLEGEFGGIVKLQPILWEHEPLRATSHFQEQITPPSAVDIVICILWSRLGTRLPEQYQRADGTPAPAGTEWEFEEAARSYRERGKPDLLVYRKTAEALASITDETALYKRLEQKRALDVFIERWFGNPDTSFKAAFHPFASLDEFELLLRTHLSKLIGDRLPKQITPDGVAPPILWHKGSPYRGLEHFDAEHAPVFFGRTRAIGEIKQGLIQQAANGCAFLLIFGMSGCGKSSLVRAGLLRNLTQPGVVEGIGLWRWSIFRPSDSAGDLFDGLALSLLRKEGLPELEAGGLDAHELAAVLREAPRRVVAPLRVALQRAAEAVAGKQGVEEPPAARLAVVVDQMEELFTLDRVDTQQREGFVAVLSALARSGLVWVIATMRSDFYPHCADLPELVSMKEGAGQYDLLPPIPAEIGQMIRYPARAAGLRFEMDPRTGVELDAVLHEAAARDPQALPLLQFTLNELYKQRTEAGVLTIAAYEQMGRLEGALARRAEEALTALDPPAQEVLPTLLRALVSVRHGEGNIVTGRRVPLATLASTRECKALVDAFIDARLLVTDRADDGQAVVGVAHEALLRRWPRVQHWLEEDRDFLRTRERVAMAAARWREEGKRSDFLLPEGKPVAEAEDLLARRRPDLDAGLVEYVEVSQRNVARVRRRKILSWAVVTAGILLFGVFSFVQLKRLERQRDLTVEAIASLTDVPQKLHGIAKSDSIRILDAIHHANLPTLNQTPDARSTRRARAVNLQLLAEMQRLQGHLPEALQSCQQTLAIGTQLVGDRPNAVDLRNLAVYYVTQGNILEELERYEEALAAYEQSRMNAELARDKGSTEALRDLWYSHMAIASLQRRLSHLDEASAACTMGLRLAEERAKGRRDAPSRSDLAFSYAEMGEVLEAQGDWQDAAGELSRARSYWADALGHYLNSQRLITDLASDKSDAQAQRNLGKIRKVVADLQGKIASMRRASTADEQRRGLAFHAVN